MEPNYHNMAYAWIIEPWIMSLAVLLPWDLSSFPHFVTCYCYQFLRSITIKALPFLFLATHIIVQIYFHGLINSSKDVNLEMYIGTWVYSSCNILELWNCLHMGFVFFFFFFLVLSYSNLYYNFFICISHSNFLFRGISIIPFQTAKS